MTTARPHSIFGDELIQAKELNRRPGQVLDKALSHPVTITRNNEFFTLIRREDISSLVNQADQTKEVFELTSAAFLLLHGGEIDTTHPFGWLHAFDTDEIQELVKEVTSAYRKAEFADEYREELQAVIHEWHESAIAIQSDDLTDAWDSPAGEIPLTQPVMQ